MKTGKKQDSSRFGWILIGGLTLVWVLGGLFWLQSLVVPDSFYHRLFRLFPDLLTLLGWTLTFTLVVVWGGMLWTLYQRNSAPVPPLTPDELLKLAPEQFERHVALIFRHKGFQVRYRGGSGDHGVDLEVFPPTHRLGVVQCKRYSSTVGEQVVRDLFGTMLHEKASHAFLVTAGEISEAAYTWALGKPITLVDGKRLTELSRELQR